MQVKEVCMDYYVDVNSNQLLRYLLIRMFVLLMTIILFVKGTLLLVGFETSSFRRLRLDTCMVFLVGCSNFYQSSRLSSSLQLVIVHFLNEGITKKLLPV